MKVIAVLMALGLVIGSVAIGGIGKVETGTSEKDFTTGSVSFSAPQIADNGAYSVLVMDNATYTHNAGAPMLPYYTKVYYFPLGTKVSIECTPQHISTIKLDKKLMPAPQPVVMGQSKEVIKENSEIYGTDAPYPNSWYTYTLGGGLHDGKHVTILALHTFPCRYNPVENTIMSADSFNIKINYKLPEKTISSLGDKDLLIIAPSSFKDALQPLIDYKEQHGIRTMLMTVEDIYSSYNGRDGAEKVKYAIKDAIEQHGIKYVLLVGGKKSYITGNWGYDGPTKVDDSLWWVPVRYAALDDMTEHGYVSDLYFADIYDSHGNFSNWDTNGNGVYAEWRFQGKDTPDFYPDVFVGRLAVRSVKELQNVVAKIVEYEDVTAGSQWFNKMLLIGGDTFDDKDELCEGEISTEWFYDKHMSNNFEKTSLFVSDGTLPFQGRDDKIGGKFAWINVIKTMNTGFGFVVMDGHGSPTAWATHFKGHASHNDPWVNGLMTYNMDLLQNKGMYPVVVIGGCHNSEFNISLLDFQKNAWTYQPTYECFGWHLVKMAGKGAIATFGNTGLGYGATGGDNNKNGIPDCVEFNGGYIEDLLFSVYGDEGKHVLGDVWGTSIQEYINKYPPLDDKIDCKTIEEWVLLGDPTLMIGGYS